MDPTRSIVQGSEVLNDPYSGSGPPKPATWRQKHFSGWRLGILSGTVMATIVLILNIVLVVQFRSISGHDDHQVPNTVFEGNCNKTKRLNIGLHFLLNILSTVLLGASNYAMQCLAAPTRPEIDRAHTKWQWLDIGVPSIRNIFSISRKRIALWTLLVLSSFPLHLM